jgi:hypothetical protein
MCGLIGSLRSDSETLAWGMRRSISICLPKRSTHCLALLIAVLMRGQLLGLCRSRLESLHQSGLLNPAWISQQWQAFEAGQLSWPRAWSLVVLGEFVHRERMP